MKVTLSKSLPLSQGQTVSPLVQEKGQRVTDWRIGEG